MSRLDRALHQARHHFADGEIPVACVLGREADGRRQRLVVLTDRRLLVTGRRTEPLVELAVDGCALRLDVRAATLQFDDPAGTVRLRDVCPISAQVLRDLLRWRHVGTPPLAPTTLLVAG